MSEETMISEREARLRERAAFYAGSNWQYNYLGVTQERDANVRNIHSDGAARLAAVHRYPLPKVTRPRVVRDPLSPCVDWRVIPICGEPTLMWRTNDEEGRSIWKVYPLDNGGVHHMPTTERVKLWAALLANPTETVDADA